MKIVISTVPLRDDNSRTNYPPVGSLAILQSLTSIGYNPLFYDIDGLRPSLEEVREYLKREEPNVIGISAIVSTTYAYVKKLVILIREVLPDCVIIVGGTLAVSYKVLLKILKVDFCVIGEGELIIRNLITYLDKKGRNDYDILKKIKGICFSDNNGDIIFTGFERQLRSEEFTDPDYEILEICSNIDNYIIKPYFYPEFKDDKRSYEKKRIGKKLGTVVSAKGCVARCTFCHRWDKGIRILSVDKVISRIKYLMDRYNVGFISFGDENFGATKKWINDFIEKISPLDILYRISGLRCHNVNSDILNRLKNSGCVTVQFGIESGSDKMLNVMEKKVDVKTNIDTLIETNKAGLFSVYSMVLGMPGESPETVKENIEFLNKVTEVLPEPPHRRTSINYLVVLPGTPVFEYAKHIGLIGETILDEEKYLLKISDSSGGELNHLNLTDYSYFRVLSWRLKIDLSAVDNYYKENNIPVTPIGKYLILVFKKIVLRKDVHLVISYNPILYKFLFLSPIYYFVLCFIKLPKAEFILLVKDAFIKMFRKKRFTNYISLRKILEDIYKDENTKGSAEVIKYGR